MKINRFVSFLIALQIMTLLGQWAGSSGGGAAAARADLPNPAERQLAILDEIKTTNAKLDKLTALLQGGELQVKVAKAEEK